MIKVVNTIPKSLSSETGQDSEPNIAVNPARPNEIAITAFTRDPMGGANAPVFVSTDGGDTWILNSIVPSQAGSVTGTGDITPRFATAGNRFYGSVLRLPGFLRLNVLRTASFTGSSVMDVLIDRNSVDQPYTQASTVASGVDAGKDRVYIGLNDFAAPGAQTATVEQSLDAGVTSPAFASVRVEKRSTGTGGQNGPQIRATIHTDGTVYAVFYGWRSRSGLNITSSDIVIVRDDNWGAGVNPFTALTDPSDGIAGRLVATGVQFTFNAILGQERLSGDLAIAVDPLNSSNVYVAYGGVQSGTYTLHLRRSTDRGVTWSADLRTIPNAKNPALAINSAGKVGFAYQHVTGSAPGAAPRWETHFQLTTNAFTTLDDFVLATVPANAPSPQFLPYIGDYIHMMAAGTSFYGVFSANNTPDSANFPQGITFQRNHDFATRRLLGVNNATEVPISIDPFFFRHTEPPPPTCEEITRAQEARLKQLCAKKVNSLSCRCSTCDTDDKYPVIASAADASLLNTAYDGSGGFLTAGTDANWEVGLGALSGPASVSSWIPAYVFASTAWVPSTFANANWISLFVNGDHGQLGNIDVYYRYRFNLSSSLDPAAFSISMDFYADNCVFEIYVNGQAQSSLPNGMGVLPQLGANATTAYSVKGFVKGSGARINLDNNWKRCENEIVVQVKSSATKQGFLAQNSVAAASDQSGCDCNCDCSAVKLPELKPCISVKWGDSPCDCLETDDVEVLCVTVCNCYSNVTFTNLIIGQIQVTDLQGNPVPILPNGQPSIQVIPSGPICFGDIEPCREPKVPSCVSRELVLYTRGAIGKKYRLSFTGICYDVCYHLQTEQCFTLQLCTD